MSQYPPPPLFQKPSQQVEAKPIQFKGETFDEKREVWRPVVAYEELYEVSTHGRVRSLRFINRNTNKLRDVPMILRSALTSVGYPAVTLARANVHKTRNIHSLVLEAFVGPRPNGCVCGHRDGNPTNNWISNLAWITYKENEDDKRRHGRTQCGEKNHQSKMTAERVRALRLDAMVLGAGSQALADKHGISRATSYRIASGKAWAHVDLKAEHRFVGKGLWEYRVLSGGEQ